MVNNTNNVKLALSFALLDVDVDPPSIPTPSKPSLTGRVCICTSSVCSPASKTI